MRRRYHFRILSPTFCAGLCSAAIWLTLAMPVCVTANEFIPRTGFVTLQFDDTRDLDYTHVFPLLEQYGFKASFGYVTESSALGIEGEAWKIQEIAAAGHEIQDHTTRHNYMWATHIDTTDNGVNDWIEWTLATPAQWDSLCDRSMFILDSLGIEAIGWNHPGGTSAGATVPGHPGWRWRGGVNDTLYQVIGSRYPYALGCCIYPNTAHCNLRGHNYPDRRPFFDVPHETVDNRDLDEVKTEIADAVASGLWYLAAQHVSDLDRVAKTESLLIWLAANDVEVLTCQEGWQRIYYGQPDPCANQIPQGKMLRDIDGNDKPDGFMGICRWDTVYAVPVEGVNCVRVTDEAEFFCYGPEPGPNAFSIWLHSDMGASYDVLVMWEELSFDWEVLDECVNSIWVYNQWVLIDTTQESSFLIDVEDEVDRIRFVIRLTGPAPVRIADPQLIPLAQAGIREPSRMPQLSPLTVVPNPVRSGEPIWIKSRNPVQVYDVMGRCLYKVMPEAYRSGIFISTGGLEPGVFFIGDIACPRRPAKLIVYK